jgi:hypothetical protein
MLHGFITLRLMLVISMSCVLCAPHSVLYVVARRLDGQKLELCASRGMEDLVQEAKKLKEIMQDIYSANSYSSQLAVNAEEAIKG